MKGFFTVKVSLIFSCLVISAFLNSVNAQELRQLSQAEKVSLFDRIFQRGNLCPDGFVPNGAYPKTARCIRFGGYKNCPAIAKGCVEQVMELRAPERGLFENTPSKVKYCQCPPSFSN